MGSVSQKSSEPIEKAAQLYAEMRRRGLHLRRGNGRDDALLAKLCSAIGCPDTNLAKFLKQEDRSAAWFLKEFLGVAAPFARMFHEIWQFLATEGAPKASERIRIRFGFDEDGPEDIDLEQFREYARAARQLATQVQVGHWSREAMWKLFDLARIIELPAAYNPPRYVPGKPYALPDVPHAGDAFQAMVARVRDLCQSIIDDDAEAEAPKFAKDFLEESWEGEGARSTRLAILLTDLLPSWRAIFESPDAVPLNRRLAAVEFFDSEIQPLIKNTVEEGAIPDLAPLESLSLPFWVHRWHTYEVWTTITTLQALRDYSPKLRIQDSRIPIDGHETAIVADLVSSSHPESCVVLQLETPYKKGRRRAIKPDLSICFDQSLEKESRALVVEYKQRTKLSTAHAREVAKAYLGGSPSAAGLAILNYDATPPVPGLAPAAVLLDKVQPGHVHVGAYARFVREKMREAGIEPSFKDVLVLLDVSSSMENAYREAGAREALQALARWRRAGLRVLAFNDGLVDDHVLDESETGLRCWGGTRLPRALSEAFQRFGRPSALLLVTDGGYEKPVAALGTVKLVRECTPQALLKDLEWVKRPA